MRGMRRSSKWIQRRSHPQSLFTYDDQEGDGYLIGSSVLGVLIFLNIHFNVFDVLIKNFKAYRALDPNIR